MIDFDGVAIKLWEYGDNQVTAYSKTDYSIVILDDDNIKHYYNGAMYEGGDRIRLENYDDFIYLLKLNDHLKIYIEESNYGTNSNYLFDLECSDFKSVYREYEYQYFETYYENQYMQ